MTNRWVIRSILERLVFQLRKTSNLCKDPRKNGMTLNSIRRERGKKTEREKYKKVSYENISGNVHKNHRLKHL